MNRLTLKQKKFVDAYVNNGGNGVEAIRVAGYNCRNDNSARVLASENLKKPNIILAIEQSGYNDSRIVDTKAIERGRRLDLAERRISTREDRAEFLTGVYLDEAFPINSRLQAVQILGKMYGDYLERVVLQKDKVEMPVINVTF
tara:strand:+ start:122 stop:553 length:432 start_codon:yes stop_codon:yes gene_type:complete